MTSIVSDVGEVTHQGSGSLTFNVKRYTLLA